jgi:hypothetical protein
VAQREFRENLRMLCSHHWQVRQTLRALLRIPSITCAHVAFEFLGKSIDIRKTMRLCVLFDPEPGGIDSSTLKTIDNASQQDQHHFHTTPL